LDYQNKNLNFPHFLPILKPILKQKSKQINVGNWRNPQKAQIITKVSISLEKSRSRLKSKVLANLIETKSRNLDRDSLDRRD
jgi:hypothetical protein